MGGPDRLPRGVDYLETEAGGRPAMWVVPQGSRADRVLLGLHGGGFVSGSRYTHRKMFGHLAKAVGARALLVDHRLLAEGGGYPAPADDESFMSNRDKDPSSSRR